MKIFQPYNEGPCSGVLCSGVTWGAAECLVVLCSNVMCGDVACSGVKWRGVACRVVRCLVVLWSDVLCGAVMRSEDIYRTNGVQWGAA